VSRAPALLGGRGGPGATAKTHAPGANLALAAFAPGTATMQRFLRIRAEG
jgi:hypothetical protein